MWTFLKLGIEGGHMDTTASWDIPEVTIYTILSSAPTVLIVDQYWHYVVSVNFGRLMILFYQVFRVKHRINYVSRVKIAYQAYYNFLGQIVIAKYSTFVILEQFEDAI